MARRGRPRSADAQASIFLSPEFAALLSEKRCRGCRKMKPVTDFTKSKEFSTGYTARCKACAVAYSHSISAGSKEGMRLNSRKQYRRDPEYKKAMNFNWRAKRLGAPGRVTVFDLRGMLATANGLCAYCCLSWEDLGVGYHFDHAEPIATYKLGNLKATNFPDNITVCCAFCNLAKKDMPLDQFKTWLRAVQAAPLIRERRALYVV